MIDMVRRHEVQVLRRAGHSLAETAQLVGVSQSSVQRVEAEAEVLSFDTDEERRRRGVGRPSKAEPFRAFLVGELVVQPDVMSLELLRRARSKGYDGGKSALYELVNDQGGLASALEGLGTVALERGDYETARHESDRTLLLDPDNPRAREIVSVTRYWLGDVDGAIGALEPIVRSDPTRLSARYTLALAYEKKGRVAEARELLRDLVRLNPNHADAWESLGRTSRALGDAAEAAPSTPRDGCPRTRTGPRSWPPCWVESHPLSHPLGGIDPDGAPVPSTTHRAVARCGGVSPS